MKFEKSKAKITCSDVVAQTQIEKTIHDRYVNAKKEYYHKRKKIEESQKWRWGWKDGLMEGGKKKWWWDKIGWQRKVMNRKVIMR